MRRLPVFFLIDVSDSMIGDELLLVQKGLRNVITNLKQNPVCLETVHVSVIVFAGKAKTLVPLQDIVTFYPPDLNVGSGTSLGVGLSHLMNELNSNIRRTTPEAKGDWKPLVFLFTDGNPTDDPILAINRWKNEWKNSCQTIIVSLGQEDLNPIFRSITDNIFYQASLDEKSFNQFFEWVSFSIKSTSQKISESNLHSNELLDIMEEVDFGTPSFTDVYSQNHVIIKGKCQNTAEFYLIKYQRQRNVTSISGIDFNTVKYKLKGAYKIGDDYDDLSIVSEENIININTEDLIGAPFCPCCGNQIGFAFCSCQKIHCIDPNPQSQNTCPWCGNKGNYGGVSEGFDVNRTLG